MNYIYFNVIKITKLKKGKWPSGALFNLFLGRRTRINLND